MPTPAISDTRICNMALSNIGADSTIENLAEESAEAQECRLWYDFSRLQALEANDWNFARKRKTLTDHGDDPPTGIWGFRYQYPEDGVIIRHLENPQNATVVSPLSDTSVTLSNAVPFEIEMDLTQTSKTILTNLDDAVAVYTFDQQNTAMYSPSMVIMLATALGVNIAVALTGDLGIKKDLQEIFGKMSRVAPALNANERVD